MWAVTQFWLYSMVNMSKSANHNLRIEDAWAAQIGTHTFVRVCLLLCVLIKRLCKLPSHAAAAWYSSRWAAVLLGGWDRPRKALSPFCQSIGIQWIIYVTPGGPLDSSETEQHRIQLGNLEARGHLRNQGGNQWGSRGNEQGEIKWQKNRKEL